jgi:heme A synthase
VEAAPRRGNGRRRSLAAVAQLAVVVEQGRAVGGSMVRWGTTRRPGCHL